MNKHSLLCILLLFSVTAQAQKLILQGKITYERKENLHRQIEEDDDSWFQKVKNQIPKYRVDYMQLVFNTNQSLYTLAKEEENKTISNYYWRVAFDNIVSQNLKTKQLIQQKTIYEKTYRIADSMPNFQWKITGEYREIAGYNCRKATTILMDSLFVIAFYTEDIPVSFGPESFSQLPGMILGIVIPRIHYTFFATQVDVIQVSESDFKAQWEKKAEAINQQQMLSILDEAMRSWGKYGRVNYWKMVF